MEEWLSVVGLHPDVWVYFLQQCIKLLHSQAEITLKLGAVQVKFMDQTMILSQFCPCLVYFVYLSSIPVSGL